MREKVDTEQLFLDLRLNVHFEFAAGQYLGRFYQELRDKAKIYCNICPKCGRANMPPRIICGRCYVRMGDWSECKPAGTVLVYSIIEQSFPDPGDGKQRKVPYTHAYIHLDDSPAVISHVLDETDPDKLSVGMRVEAVFRPKKEREGRLTDIVHFKVVK